MIYIVKEHLNLLGKLGIYVGSRFNSSINGFDEIQRCKLLQLSHVRWIGDGPPSSRHDAREEVTRETLAVSS